MLASDVLTSVRRNINDDSAVRWSNTVLLSHLDAAQQELFLIRPDLFLDNDGLMTQPGEVTATTDTLGVGHEWRAALAYATSAGALMEDTDDPANVSRGELYRAMFEKLSKGL